MTNKKGYRKRGILFQLALDKLVDGETPRRDVRGPAPPKGTFVYIYVQRCPLFYAGKP